MLTTESPSDRNPLALAAQVGIAVAAGLIPIFLPASDLRYHALVFLVAFGLATLGVIARMGLVRSLLLFAFGISMILNPNKFFVGKEYVLSFGGIPAYFLSLTDLCLILLLCLPSPGKRSNGFRGGPSKGIMFVTLGMYVAFLLLSLYNAPDRELVFTQFVFEIKCMVLFLVVAFGLDHGKGEEVIERTVMPMMYGLACGVIMETGAAVAEYVRLIPTSFNVVGIEVGGFQEVLGGMQIDRVGGTYRHPNYLAVPMAVLLAPLASAALISSGVKKLFFYAATGGALVSLVLTLSRGGWLAACITILALGILTVSAPGGKAWLTRHKASLGFVVLFLLVILAAFSGTIYRKLFLSDPLNVQARAELNRMALDMISDHPLMGVGLNNAIVAGSDYGYFAVYELAAGLPPVVHNIYLLIASEIGIPGLLAFLAFLASVIGYAWRGIRAPGGGRLNILLCGLAAGMWGYLAADMFGPSLRKLEIAYQLWWHIGMVVLMSRLTLEASRNRARDGA